MRPASVRLPLPVEAADIARIQRAALAVRPGVAELAAGLDPDEMTAAWTAAILRPPLATYRVLVATDTEGRIVGFAAVGPSEDQDATESTGVVAEFCVLPNQWGAGHEDRLMHAVVATLRADGFERATWWVVASDDTTRTLLAESGWEPDGAHQELGDESGEHRVKLVRLHTAID